jgi:hypothetical protein
VEVEFYAAPNTPRPPLRLALSELRAVGDHHHCWKELKETEMSSTRETYWFVCKVCGYKSEPEDVYFFLI